MAPEPEQQPELEQQQPGPVPELQPGQLQRWEQPPEPPNSQEQAREEPPYRYSRCLVLVPGQPLELVQALNSCIRPT